MERWDGNVLMATPEERHTDILVALKGINTTITEVLKPAVDKTYDNEKDIIRIQGKVKIGQWVVMILGSAFIITIVRSAYAYMTKHPH